MAQRILVWLPSPMGDAIMCTGALRAMREHFAGDEIFFYASPIVKQVLSPSEYCDGWMEYKSHNPFAIAWELRKRRFTHAILFKNSFLSAFAAFLSGIPQRTGYARDGRSIFLTRKLYAAKNADGSYKPVSVVDYYLAAAAAIGATSADRSTKLEVDEACRVGGEKKLGKLTDGGRPVVVLVPGGAFGPSKLWPAQRFGAVADYVSEKYGARVVVSVAPNDTERAIAQKICVTSKAEIINLGETSLSLGELKALIGMASLVITNDTGPRHIAIALGRKVITLFGPNNPAWTATGYKGEMQIVGEYECVPCDKPQCKFGTSRCMEAITAQAVCRAADEMMTEGAGHA